MAGSGYPVRLHDDRTPVHPPGATGDGTELAGYILGWLDRERGVGQIEPLAVDPALARRGIGAALIGELLGRFARLGANRAWVEVEPANEAAVQACRAAGFTPCHEVVAYGRLEGPA